VFVDKVAVFDEAAFITLSASASALWMNCASLFLHGLDEQMIMAACGLSITMRRFPRGH
jgi:hypothetical protein